MSWAPPGKNCGLCGAGSCGEFSDLLKTGQKAREDCPFFAGTSTDCQIPPISRIPEKDVLGFEYDFALHAFPGEASARKFIQPFRADLVERWGIKTGDMIVGRPMGAGCPVQHGLRVISANEITGVLACHTVGPIEVRHADAVHDIQAYHVIGFEGLAETVRREPVFGFRQRFLPASCMMQISHTGVVNMVLRKSGGTHVRVEDIRILS